MLPSLITTGGPEIQEKRASKTNLDAMVTIRKVLQGFELLVNNPDAGFMGPNGDFFDVFGCLAQLFQSCINMLGSLNGGLRVKFGYRVLDKNNVRMSLQRLEEQTYRGKTP
jgi:hypothetical protein